MLVIPGLAHRLHPLGILPRTDMLPIMDPPAHPPDPPHRQSSQSNPPCRYSFLAHSNKSYSAKVRADRPFPYPLIHLCRLVRMAAIFLLVSLSLTVSLHIPSCKYLPVSLPMIITPAIIFSLSIESRPPNLPYVGSLASLVIVGRISSVVILAIQVTLVVLVTRVIIPSLRIILILVIPAFGYLLPPRWGPLGTLPFGVRSGPAKLGTAIYQLSGMS